MMDLNSNRIEVSWDRNSRKSIEFAKSIYRTARNLGRKIVNVNNEEISNFSPDIELIYVEPIEVSLNQFSVRVLDETGDRRIIWDSSSKAQVEEAKLKFKQYIDAGCRIYAVSPNGKKGARIMDFSDNLEEVYVEEDRKSIKEKFEDFVKKFKSIEVLPKTFPG